MNHNKLDKLLDEAIERGDYSTAENLSKQICKEKNIKIEKIGSPEKFAKNIIKKNSDLKDASIIFSPIKRASIIGKICSIAAAFFVVVFAVFLAVRLLPDLPNQISQPANTVEQTSEPTSEEIKLPPLIEKHKNIQTIALAYGYTHYTDDEIANCKYLLTRNNDKYNSEAYINNKLQTFDPSEADFINLLEFIDKYSLLMTYKRDNKADMCANSNRLFEKTDDQIIFKSRYYYIEIKFLDGSSHVISFLNDTNIDNLTEVPAELRKIIPFNRMKPAIDETDDIKEINIQMDYGNSVFFTMNIYSEKNIYYYDKQIFVNNKKSCKQEHQNISDEEYAKLINLIKKHQIESDDIFFNKEHSKILSTSSIGISYVDGTLRNLVVHNYEKPVQNDEIISNDIFQSLFDFCDKYYYEKSFDIDYSSINKVVVEKVLKGNKSYTFSIDKLGEKNNCELLYISDKYFYKKEVVFEYDFLLKNFTKEQLENSPKNSDEIGFFSITLLEKSGIEIVYYLSIFSDEMAKRYNEYEEYTKDVLNAIDTFSAWWELAYLKDGKMKKANYISFCEVNNGYKGIGTEYGLYSEGFYCNTTDPYQSEIMNISIEQMKYISDLVDKMRNFYYDPKNAKLIKNVDVNNCITLTVLYSESTETLKFPKYLFDIDINNQLKAFGK